jgi:hypothetical protein
MATPLLKCSKEKRDDFACLKDFENGVINTHGQFAVMTL